MENLELELGTCAVHGMSDTLYIYTFSASEPVQLLWNQAAGLLTAVLKPNSLATAQSFGLDLTNWITTHSSSHNARAAADGDEQTKSCEDAQLASALCS